MSSTVTLPPGPQRAVDFETVRNGIVASVRQALAFWSARPIESSIRAISRRSGDKVGVWMLPFPCYKPATFGGDERFLRPGPFRDLSDYLWERGAARHTITNDADIGPDKQDWALFVFADYVRGPALMALEMTAIEGLVDRGECSPWDIDDEVLMRVATSMARWEVERTTLVRSVCPLAGLRIGGQQTIDLGAGVRLSDWDERTRHIYESLHPDVYEWDDFRRPMGNALLLEVSFDSEHGEKAYASPNPLVAIVRERIDIAKAALFGAVVADGPFAEGVCTIVIREMVLVGRINRQLNPGAHVGLLDDVAIMRARRLHSEFVAFAKQWPEFQRALFHLGRAFVAELPRDVLLESAIGLDGLLVPGGDQAAYKFCLHGAVLLATNSSSGEELYRALSDIYKARSRAAHGHGASQLEESLATRARRLLADALVAVVDRVRGGELSVDCKSGGVPDAVARLVRQKATASQS